MCECAIAHVVALWKCANVWSHILSLFKNVRRCNCTFCRSLKKCDLEIRIFFAHLPFLKELFCNLYEVQKSVISKFALFCTFALWKCAYVRSHILSLYKNVRMCKCTFFRSLKMCNCAITLFLQFLNLQLHIRSFKKSEPAKKIFKIKYLFIDHNNTMTSSI